MSRALRHEPWNYEIELDADGWVRVDDLVHALRQQSEWADLDRIKLTTMVEASSKRRHEISGGRIRALYGHSVENGIQKAARVPPVRLFHGTGPLSWEMIASRGLLPMGRQYVHLSVDAETAAVVGRRKSRDPVILSVDAMAAHVAGAHFYEGNQKVWLADHVAPEYIAVAS